MRAYLLGFVDTRQWPPVLVGAGIYSESHGDITTDQKRAFAVEMSSVDAETYAEAADLLLDMVKEQPWFAWVWKLMCEGKPSQKAHEFCERQAVEWMQMAQEHKP